MDQMAEGRLGRPNIGVREAFPGTLRRSIGNTSPVEIMDREAEPASRVRRRALRTNLIRGVWRSLPRSCGPLSPRLRRVRRPGRGAYYPGTARPSAPAIPARPTRAVGAQQD